MVDTLELMADAIDGARYQHPDHPRDRPRPFSEADTNDREYALRLARAALAAVKDRQVGVADIPADQRFSFKITPLPGRLLDAATVGKSMTALAGFHASLGKDILPEVKWVTCITGVELEADGSFRLDVAVLTKEKQKSVLTTGDGG